MALHSQKGNPPSFDGEHSAWRSSAAALGAGDRSGALRQARPW